MRSSGKPFTAVSLLPDEVSSVTVYVDSGTVRTHLYPFKGKRKRDAIAARILSKKSYVSISRGSAHETAFALQMLKKGEHVSAQRGREAAQG